jgi:hypothetical protein
MNVILVVVDIQHIHAVLFKHPTTSSRSQAVLVLMKSRLQRSRSIHLPMWQPQR